MTKETTARGARAKAPSRDIYTETTDRIVAELEAGPLSMGAAMGCQRLPRPRPAEERADPFALFRHKRSAVVGRGDRGALSLAGLANL